MSLGFETSPLKNPNNCTDVYTPSFWLGKPGALTQIRMPDAGWPRSSSDNFAVHNLLDGQAVDRSPYLSRVWQFQHEWLKPDVMSVFMEYATRQRGIGPFILIDPQMKNLLTPNQASGTDALHTSEGFQSDDATTVITNLDTFTRSVTGSWGTEPVSGQTWQHPNAPSAFSVNGTQGRIAVSVANVLYYGFVQTGSPNGSSDHSVKASLTLAVLPLTQPITLRMAGRRLDNSNYYEAQVSIAITTGVATLTLQKNVAGVFTQIAGPFSVGTHSAGNTWSIQIDVRGSTISGRAWNEATSTDPGSSQLSVTDTSITIGGSAGVGVREETGNTNGLTNLSVDNFQVTSYPSNSLTSSTDDIMQGERSIAWTLSPPVSGTGTTLRVISPTGLYGFCVPPAKKIAFSGYVKLGSTSLDNSVQVTPTVVFMNGQGAVQSTLSGAVITAVTGTAGSGWQSFCVTGSVPAGQPGVYLEPRFTVVNTTATTQTVFLFDQLQLEIIDGTTCTQWEYGQGQPLIGVRGDGENVPRILRTNMNFIAVEVT